MVVLRELFDDFKRKRQVQTLQLSFQLILTCLSTSSVSAVVSREPVDDYVRLHPGEAVSSDLISVPDPAFDPAADLAAAYRLHLLPLSFPESRLTSLCACTPVKL